MTWAILSPAVIVRGVSLSLRSSTKILPLKSGSIVPPITCTLWWKERPLRDAIFAYVPGGGWRAISVGMDAVPPLGNIMIGSVWAL